MHSASTKNQSNHRIFKPLNFSFFYRILTDAGNVGRAAVLAEGTLIAQHWGKTTFGALVFLSISILTPWEEECLGMWYKRPHKSHGEYGISTADPSLNPIFSWWGVHLSRFSHSTQRERRFLSATAFTRIIWKCHFYFLETKLYFCILQDPHIKYLRLLLSIYCILNIRGETLWIFHFRVNKIRAEESPQNLIHKAEN